MATGSLHLHLALGIAFLALIWAQKASKLRALTLILALLLLLTGAFNFMTRMTGAPAGWHALIGIKILLALHALSMAVLLARGQTDPAKAARWRKGALISASLAAAIGLYYSNFAR